MFERAGFIARQRQLGQRGAPRVIMRLDLS